MSDTRRISDRQTDRQKYGKTRRQTYRQRYSRMDGRTEGQTAYPKERQSYREVHRERHLKHRQHSERSWDKDSLTDGRTRMNGQKHWKGQGTTYLTNTLQRVPRHGPNKFSQFALSTSIISFVFRRIINVASDAFNNAAIA